MIYKVIGTLLVLLLLVPISAYAVNRTKSLSDTVTTTNTLKKQDTKKLSQVITITSSLSKKITKSLTDTISITASISKRDSKPLSQTMTITVTLTKTNGKKLSEIIIITDSIKKTNSKKLTESIMVSNIISVPRTKSLSESLSLVVTLVTSGTTSKSLSDSISLTDIMTNSFSHLNSVTIIESLIIVDNLQILQVVNFTSNVVDSLSIQDSITTNLMSSGNINLIESMSISDTISINGTIIEPELVIKPMYDDPRYLPSVLRPSLGNTHFHDGFTINGVVFDINHFNNNVDTQYIVPRTPITITIKVLNHNGDGNWGHGAIYFGDVGIIIDKHDGMTVIDNVDQTVVVTNINVRENIYTYFDFTFIPLKVMKPSEIHLIFWDGSGRVIQSHIKDGISFDNKPVIEVDMSIHYKCFGGVCMP